MNTEVTVHVIIRMILSCDKQVGLFDVIKNGYDKDDDLKDLEELMYDNSKEAGNKMSINDMIKSFELNESDKTSKEEETSDYKELLESMRNNEEEDGPSGLAEKTRKQQESVQREEEKYDNLLNTLQTQTLIRKVDDVTRSKGKDSQNSKIKSTDKSDAEISISFSFPLIAQFLRNILIYFKALSTSPAL